MPYSITTKDGITINNIPDDVPANSDVLKERVAKIRGDTHPAEQPKTLIPTESRFIQDKAPNPTDGMSGLDKLRAGTGKAFVDVGRGVGGLAGVVSREDVDEARKLDAPLMDTGAGMTGNVLGNMALFAPMSAIPGANTVGGGALIGGLSGLVQPVGPGDSRGENVALGTAVGGAIPALARAGKAIKAAAIDPFTDAGRDRIAGGVINRTAADKAKAYANLLNTKGKTAGFNPTAGQAAQDDGIAALERAVRATAPNEYGAVERTQRQALADAVRSVGGDDIAKGAAESARDAAANPLYEAAKRAKVNADSDLKGLLNKPSLSSAWKRAERLAAENGESLVIGKNAPAQQVKTGVLDASGNPIARDVPEQFAQYSGRGLHYLKMALDDMMDDPMSGIGRNEKTALIKTKDQLLGWMDKNIPEYGLARKAYADMSKPINAMDVGNALRDKFIPALYRDMDSPLQLNHSALANAVDNGGDRLAQSVTGFKGAKLDNTLSPQQMETIRNVLSDSQLVKGAEQGGRGVGSDTVQKTAMSHLIAEAGVPNWISSVARVPGGWAKRASDVLYGGSDDAVQARLAEALRDPQQAAKLMQSAGVSPSKIAEVLKTIGQGAAFPLPAIMNAQQ
jgi:hypothetical protein